MSAIDPQSLQQHRSYLLRYAILQLRDSALAEDAVQETLMAALESNGYSAQSTLRTWLIGILKHKLMDVLRKRARESQFDVPENGDESELIDTLFKQNGHWADPPQVWNAPEQAMENAHFWEVFEQCNRLMPLKTARAFMMREFMDMTTDEICQELGITSTNCWVLLHRARLSLRECLDLNWFGNAR